MEQSKVRGYGIRGWVLIIWIATAFLAYTAIGNYPLNILSDLYGGQQTLSTIYTTASIIGVIVQLIASSFIGKLKSVKKLGCIMGVLSIVCLLGIMFIPGFEPGSTLQRVWQVVYALGTVFSVMYGTFALSILVGQWFPTRKGSVMGIATFAFPIGNGVLGAFAGAAFKGGTPHIAQAFAPFLIIFIIGLILGLVFIPDYPEEVGAYRDNNANMTPEMAKAMMEAEIENKKTTVWKPVSYTHLSRLLAGNFLKPILIGNPEEIKAVAEEECFNINGAEIIDPASYGKMDEMVDKMVELRKGKMTPDQCRDALEKGNYFGTMLVAMGYADCLLGGATYSTADTVRPALQLVKTKPENNIVSSCFILVREAATGSNEVLAMGDCAINIKPSEDRCV